ncbi:MAG: hypothetical protein ACKOC5_00925, partial [Chloroflexota bacterium]
MIDSPLWTEDPDWVEQAQAWIVAQLARAGRRPSGPPVQLRRQVWSQVLEIPCEGGKFYFKAVAPQALYEVRLAQALAAWETQLVLPVLAADLRRGWLLMPDGGPRLREAIRSTGSADLWGEFLLRYAGFQQRLAARLPELHDLGVPDQRLERLPAIFQDLLAGREFLLFGMENGLTDDQYARLQGLPARLQILIERLAGFGLPATLNQSDLNDANIFYTERRDGWRFAMYDWGDASLGHPFCSLRVPRVSMEISLGWEDEWDARGLPYIDAYLQAWVQAGQGRWTLPQLQHAYRLSMPLASIGRAMEWRRAIAGAT